MIGTNISFAKEKNGYDREQVDSYIKKLSDAYQTTYLEYLDISGKYKSLLEEREKPNAQGAAELSPDVIAKTLINTEMLAQKIITDAQAEATELIKDARKAVNGANDETAKAKEEARRIVNDANAEADRMAAQARESFEQARKIMEQAAKEVEKTLTFHTPEEEISTAA